MKLFTLWCLSFLLIISMVFAEQAEQQEIKIPLKDSADYWTIRSQAITDLLPLLTRKRKEMKENIKLLADYLLLIDKAEGFAASDIEVPDDPELYAKAVGIYDKFKEKKIMIPKKSLTWDQTAELAMKFVLVDGYESVEVDGNEEMDQYKKICLHKEKYAKKVHLELKGYTTKLLKGWLYLGTIGKQADFRVYAYKEKQKVEDARKELIRQRREQSAARERARREHSREVRMRRHYGYYR